MSKILSKLRNTKLILLSRRFSKLFYSYKFKVAKDDIIQVSNTTRYNRHPDLFLFCQEHLGKTGNIKILSFGCSNGEECFSLREYFPNANIIGCDINTKSLELAKNKNKDKNINFILSNEENLLKQGPFNLIFALSVLCKEPEGRLLNNISKVFPFQTFNRIVKSLDNILLNDGLLVIRNANYCFEETSFFKKYDCLSSKESEFPIFNIDGTKKNPIKKHCEIFNKNK